MDLIPLEISSSTVFWGGRSKRANPESSETEMGEWAQGRVLGPWGGWLAGTE